MLCWNTNAAKWTLVYSNGDYNTYDVTKSLNSNSSSPNWPLPYLSLLGPAGTDHSFHIGDFNGDGLDDILQLEYNQSTQATTYDLFYSKGNLNFVHENGTYPGHVGHQGNFICDFNGDGQADILSSYTGKIISFHNNDNSMRVTSIEHAGKSLDITYTSLTQDQDYVSTTAPNNYYLAKTLPLKVVKTISDNGSVNNTYKYEGLLYHKYGLGIRGFKKFIATNSSNQTVYKTFELESTIPYIKEQQIFDGLGSFSYGILTSFQQLDFPGGANGKSHIIINSPLETTNNIDGSTTITTITTGSTTSGTVFYDFGKTESVSVRTKDLLGGLSSLTTATYNYGSNWVTLKGRPERMTVYNEIDPLGTNGITRTTEYTYYPNGDLQTVLRDPGTTNETVTTYQYDYQSTSNPYGNVVRTDLNATGVAGTITNQISYTSDGKFVSSEVNPMGYTTTYSYGNLTACWGNILSKTNYKGMQTQYTYDALNRITKEKDSQSGIEIYTNYEWPTSSQYTSSLTGAHLVISTTNSYDATFKAKVFDKYGDILREVSPGTFSDIYMDYTYDASGHIETATGPYNILNPTTPFVTTNYTYDDWGRETEQNTDNGGSTIQTSYTINNGLLNTTSTNLGANTWKTIITCGKTLKSIINSGTPNHTIDYTYYGNGTIASTIVNSSTPSGGKTFTNTVDPYGRITAKTEPNTGTISYTYNALGQVSSETRANGTVYDYTYDLLGRVTQKKEPSKSTGYTFTYENTNGLGSTGELIQKTSPNGHAKDYDYTSEGWLQSITEDNFFETIYSYYPNGDLQRYTFDNDISIEYTYTYAGVVKDATLLTGTHFTNNQKLWSSWGLTRNGNLRGAYFYDVGNSPGYADRRTYDVHGLLERHEIVNINLMSTNIVDNRYSFNIHSRNLMWRKDDLPGRNNTEQFTYDNNYDVIKTVSQSISGGPVNQIMSLDYDPHGNIRNKDDVAPPNVNYQWKYNDYALKTVPMPGPPPFPSTVAIPHFKQEVSYTAFEKVEQIREDQNNEVFFTYGADDTRVSAAYTDLTTGSAGSPYKAKHYYKNYERIDFSTGTEELFYVWAGDKLIAILKLFSQPGQPTISNIYYPVQDYLGSITHILDINHLNGPATNGILEERSFDAWGRIRDPNNWIPYPVGGHPGFWITDRGYSGHEHIWQPTFANFYDNNIINMDGRMYDPLVGRMFSPDPVIPNIANSQDYNRYTYARNNPLKYTDPDGTTPVHAVAFIVGAIVGGTINVVTHWDDIYNGNNVNWGKFGTAFGIGAVAGMVTVATGGSAMPAATGMTVTSYAAAGAMTGALGAGSGAIIRSYGNHLAFQDPLMTDDQFLMEVTGGAVFSGVAYGVIGRMKGLPWIKQKVETQKVTVDLWQKVGDPPPPRPISPNAKGDAGVNRAMTALKEAGYDIAAREVTVEASGVRVRVDFAIIDDGIVHLHEVKNGPFAGFTPNQKIVYPQMLEGIPIIPRGINAATVFGSQNVGIPTTRYTLTITKY